MRDKQEQIDLLELTEEAGSSAGARSPRRASQGTRRPPLRPAAPSLRSGQPAPAKPEPEYKITVEKIALKGGATFTDEAVSAPPTVLKLSDLAVQVDDVTWPNIRPMNLALAVGLPGGGKVSAKGPVKIEPLDLTLTLTTRDAPIEPYRAYFPFPASFSGRFNSDSQNRVRIVNGKLTALVPRQQLGHQPGGDGAGCQGAAAAPRADGDQRYRLRLAHPRAGRPRCC